MTFVITQGCCNDASCIAVCPVQCIRPRPGEPDFKTAEQLYIDPSTCIDCAACLDECPVSAIHADYDLPGHLSDFLQINADYFNGNPIVQEDEPVRARRSLPDGRRHLRVAIVGSGPSACYAAGALSEIKGVEVSIFDRLPTPFGLVRSGVAPDHPQTKLMGDRFRSMLSRGSVSCYFNVEVGRDISIKELLEHHHAVVWAAGAAGDRKLEIPGEDLPGSYSAREFVAWYNGHPDHADREFDLSGKRAVVIGTGNVALDVARVLCRPAAAYQTTDMANHAIASLQASSVREVVVVGRRGPKHAAFTLPEVLALSRLEGVELLAHENEMAFDRVNRSRLLQRKIDVIEEAAARSRHGDRNSSITLRFFMTPVSINGSDRVESVTFSRQEQVVEGESTMSQSEGFETVETSLLIRAVGFRGESVDGLPFDETTGTIPNSDGRITLQPGGERVAGLYCSGWIKRGAVGVIGTNGPDAVETVEALLSDFEAGVLTDPQHGPDHMADLIYQRHPDVIDNAGWLRINQAERQAGTVADRPRVKFTTIDEMLRAARNASR